MADSNLFSELRRRNVFKVGIAYAVIAWLLIEVASILFPIFEVPSEVLTGVVIVVAIGFLAALIIAWLFEMTPHGMKRTEDILPDERLPYWSKRKFAALIIGSAVIAGALLLFQILFQNH
jgi:adenylate cyclase